MENNNQKVLPDVIKKRVAVGMFFVYLLFFICVLRIGSLSKNDTLSQTATNQSTEKISLYNLRKDIFDCNLNKLTNQTAEDITLFFPTDEGIKSAEKLCGAGSFAVKRLQEGRAVYEKVKSNGEDGTVALKKYIRYNETQTASHIIGYINSENKGVCGIEKGMEEYLYSDDFANISYQKDAKNGVLTGIKYKTNQPNGNNGVVLTLDKNMQQIAEESIKGVECGAVVIVEADSGKIRAGASVPTFNPQNPADSLKNENSPFLNRAFNNYSVGSVFKTCVAAAGLEKSKEKPNKYTCKGFVNINGQRYNCHKLSGHGTLNLTSALAYSCNCYFYRYSAKIGAQNIFDLSSLCGFGTNKNLGGGLVIKKGVLPNINTIKTNKNALANFSIGQGEFTLSPVAITSLYSAVVNNGEYVSPSILEGVVENGKFIPQEDDFPTTKVMSKTNAETVKTMLKKCLKKGTGVGAKPNKATAGGKTATAQTGWIKNGKEIENGWFCGFFEKGGKNYVVTVLVEDVKTQKVTPAEIFKEIVDKIFPL